MQKHCPLFSGTRGRKCLCYVWTDLEGSSNWGKALQYGSQEHPHHFMFLWWGGPGTCPGCLPPSLCWITSRRWIYSVRDCSGSSAGKSDFSEPELVDGCSLRGRRWDALGRGLPNLVELVLGHSPVSRVGGELTAGGSSSTSVLAPGAV